MTTSDVTPATNTSALVAVLDASGTIVSVNEAWNIFCLERGGEPDRAGAGISYLEVCDTATDEPSQLIAVAIRAALMGELPAPETVQISCSANGRHDVFDVLISARSEAVGAVVSLSPVRAREVSMHEELTQGLLEIGTGLQQLLALNADPQRVGLDPDLLEDVRDVVGRLWNALLGPAEKGPPV